MAQGSVVSSHVSPIVEVCIRALQSVHSSHDLIVAAGRLIVADAEANNRFYQLKASATEDRLLAFLEKYEQLADSLSTTYSSFESDAKAGTAGLLREMLAIHEWLSRSP